MLQKKLLAKWRKIGYRMEGERLSTLWWCAPRMIPEAEMYSIQSFDVKSGGPLNFSQHILLINGIDKKLEDVSIYKRYLSLVTLYFLNS